MNTASLVFIFTVSLNIFILYLGGMAETLASPVGGRSMIRDSLKRHWLYKGGYLLLWGVLAILIQRLTMILPRGEALFISFFTLAYLILRSLFIFILSRIRGAEHREDIVKAVDRLFRDPVLLIPVLIIGYSRITVYQSLIVVVSAWAGLGIALLVFVSIRVKVDLEAGRPRLKGSNMMILSAALMAMLLIALDQAFFIRFMP